MNNPRISLAYGIAMGGTLGATLGAVLPLLLLSVWLLLFESLKLPDELVDPVIHHRGVSALIGAAIGAYWGWKRIRRLEK